ncbi:uncharacterized protein [Asterias amurensis]|uniref:uncharacterized protein n=1 Tax=Asterias amurensis TaxID=7602 RepID=UPI003AB7DA54
MGDDLGREGNKEEKKLFTIPTAKDIARLEHGKSKVKSYFKSQFGNQLTSTSGKSTSLSVAKTSESSTNATTLAAETANQAVQERNNVTNNSDNTKESAGNDLNIDASTAYRSTEPSTSDNVQDKGAKRKIGSSFADKFAALRDAPDYEAPLNPAKRPMLSTAILAAPVSISNKAPTGANSIIVNTRQRGNPILKHIRNIPWEFGDIVPDYVMGRTVCALYLSLRYHHLNPNYIHNRLKDLGHHYELRVLLVQVDVKDPHHSLKELARMALMADCTLILAWSTEEAGRYLETYKSYENKSADALKEKIDTDYLSKVTDVLSTVRSVNKTDAVTLVSTFGTFEKIISASQEDLYLCPGFGPQKAKKLFNILREPFLKANKKPQKTENEEKKQTEDKTEEVTAADAAGESAAASTSTATAASSAIS